MDDKHLPYNLALIPFLKAWLFEKCFSYCVSYWYPGVSQDEILFLHKKEFISLDHDEYTKIKDALGERNDLLPSWE